MKKLLIVLLCCAALTVTVWGADLTLTRLSTTCAVGEDGVCRLEQKAELHADETLTEVTLPVGPRASKISGGPAQYRVHTEQDASYITFSSDEGFSGDFTLTVDYETRDRASAVDGGQTLSAELVSGLWEIPAERYSFTVVLPKETSAQPDFVSSYYADDVEDHLTVSTEGRAVSGILRGGLLDRESFTMNLSVPEGYFHLSGGSAPHGAGQWILAVLILLLTAAAAFYWFRFLRGGWIRAQARTVPPDGMTPAEMPLLLCEGEPAFSLLLCDWAQDGYLTVTERREGRILLRKSMDMGAERREEERTVFHALFAGSDVCESGSDTYAKASAGAASLLRRYWLRRLYDRRSGSPLVLRAAAALTGALALVYAMSSLLPASGIRWLLLIAAFAAGAGCGWVISHACRRAAVLDWPWIGAGAAALILLYVLGRLGGGLSLMVLALAVNLAAGLLTRHGGRLTPAGADTVEQCVGFRRFLRHADEAHLAMVHQRDPQTLYRMMLYACAAGLDGVFLRRLGDVELEPCSWLIPADGAESHAEAFRLQLRRILKKLDA